MNRFLMLALLMLGSALTLAQNDAAQAEPVQPVQEDAVVIRLGDQEETVADFKRYYEIALHGVAAQQGMVVDDALRAQLEPFKERFLEQRVMEMVILDEAAKRGLSVSEDEVQAQIDQVKSSLGEDQTLEEVLPELGFEDEAQLRGYLEEQLLASQLVDELRAGISVSDEEVAAAYDERQSEFATPEQVCARHILVETEDEANALLSELQGGADFAQLAQENSTDPGSASQGGDLGCFSREMMVEPFADAAFGVAGNEVVGPVQSDFGYHLIQVYDRQEAGTAPLEEVAPQLKAQLEQQALLDELQALRDASGVEVHPEALGIADTAQ